MQDGCSETGVSVAFTVRAMDAGPVLAQASVPMDADIQAPELLRQLFSLGTRLLIERLPQVWSGEAAALAIPQASFVLPRAANLVECFIWRGSSPRDPTGKHFPQAATVSWHPKGDFKDGNRQA